MSETIKMYRKRLIPAECVELKDDRILLYDGKILVTSWKALKPRPDLSCGNSLYLLSDGIKISRFFGQNGNFLYWYCDIIDAVFSAADRTWVFTDLLADVKIYPDRSIRVVDLDELAEAYEKGILSETLLLRALRRLNRLLTMVYDRSFEKISSVLTETRYLPDFSSPGQ
ncbi:MAG: DUF402 domain-containing protein [Lachnospiraceae bacterium]|jgi:predicted RNA-binding protein associated with RNAse of E/G family